jgi:hypothetical protein
MRMSYYIISRKRVSQGFTVTFVTNSEKDVLEVIKHNYPRDLRLAQIYATHGLGRTSLDRARTAAKAMTKYYQ